MKRHYMIQESKNSLDELCDKADLRGIYTVPSLDRGLVYMYRDGEFALVTSSGQLRMRIGAAETVARELLEILKDIRELERMGVIA